MKALILAPFDSRYLERLGEQSEVIYEAWTETRHLYKPSDLAARLRDEEITAVVVEGDVLTEEVFSVPSLRIVGVCRNALNLIDISAATERGIPVLHTPNRNAVAVAELTIGLMISVARQIPAAHQFVKGRGWTNPMDPYITYRGPELAKSTVGIIGLGRIGAEVARRAQCMGARVVACDPYAKPRLAGSLSVRLLSLPQLLKRSDFVSLHTAQTEATEHLIDAKALDMMKPTAYLVSIGAANIVDEAALAGALRERRIAGAALDVFRGHMISTSSPLLDVDNVILTPHIGGATPQTITRQSRMIVEDIERFFRGDKPRHVANPEALAKAHEG